MRLPVLLMLCAAGCGSKATEGGGSAAKGQTETATTWTVAGTAFPVTLLPPVLTMPTYFAKHPGDIIDSAALTELETKRMPDFSMYYLTDAPPNEKQCIGYLLILFADPEPDLIAKWGQPTAGPLRGDGIMVNTILNDCWESATNHVKACLTQNGDKRTQWTLEIKKS